MFFESCKSILYSDTLLPDIFITEYMPSMDGDCVKIYMHCLFLSKHKKQDNPEGISKKFDIDLDKVKSAFLNLENLGLLSRRENGIILNDLKEREISKIYRMKSTSTPEEAILSSERNKRRNEILSAINNKFFQGVMAPSWYTDIDAWFDRYKFDEDVMYMLFQHCFNYKALNKHYIAKVADNWHSRDVKTSFDVDRYDTEYQKFKDIKINIIKKLKLNRNLTEYEEEYIEKWVLDYSFCFDIIELALKKTTAKTNPNFKYIHVILSDWFDKKLATKDDIITYEKDRKNQTDKNRPVKQATPQNKNYEQREYDDSYYNNLYYKAGTNSKA